jgi:uncharacterized membrane protein
MKSFANAPVQRHTLCLFLIALALVSISAAQQSSGTVPPPAANYTFRTLPVPSNSTGGFANGINSNGTLIVGVFFGGPDLYYGLLYDAGRQTVVEYPDAEDTFLCGVNDLGKIIGNYGAFNSGSRYGFQYKNGIYKGIAPVPSGINDSGAIVGSYDSMSVLMVGDEITTIQYGDYTTYAAGINASGEIVGDYLNNGTSYGFTDVNGTFTTIQVPGAAGTVPTAISNSGLIAGYYWDANGPTQGFLLNNGQYATINYPGAAWTLLSGVDDAGDVVGQYSPCTSCGFLAKAPK